MEAFKEHKNFIIALFAVAVVFFYLGKNSNPAKIEVAETAKTESVSGVKADEKSNAMVLAKKTTKSSTKANGDKKELTVEEFLSLNGAAKSIEAHEALKSETAKTTMLVNSVLFLRIGAIAEIQKDGLPNPKALPKAQLLGTISYGAHEWVNHTDLKGSWYSGYAWGFGF